MKKIIFIGLIIWAILVVIDAISTYIGMNVGGFYETNRFTNMLFSSVGYGFGLLIHSVLFFLFMVTIYISWQKLSKFKNVTTIPYIIFIIGFNLIFLISVIGNIALLGGII